MIPSSLPLIRPAVTADAMAIAKVHIAASQTAYKGILPDEYLNQVSVDDRAKKWAEILDGAEQFAWVAEVENCGIVGFCNGGPEREGRTDFRGELYAIYVLDEWHGLSIGKQLVRQTAATMLERAIDGMLVWVLASNPYRRFYERLQGQLVDRKTVQCASKELIVVAYGWTDLRTVAGLRSRG